jgi:hypothetical protein
LTAEGIEANDTVEAAGIGRRGPPESISGRTRLETEGGIDFFYYKAVVGRGSRKRTFAVRPIGGESGLPTVGTALRAGAKPTVINEIAKTSPVGESAPVFRIGLKLPTVFLFILNIFLLAAIIALIVILIVGWCTMPKPQKAKAEETRSAGEKLLRENEDWPPSPAIIGSFQESKGIPPVLAPSAWFPPI